MFYLFVLKIPVHLTVVFDYINVGVKSDRKTKVKEKEIP